MLWVLVVIFFNFIGSLLYFTVGEKQKVRNS
ncbi:PLDc N-terminal domain-containing protein [Mesonia maritima]|nr:PLDc N-terminal domain-containing protein [Mesonia maritima]